MAATAAQIAELRRMIAEPTDTTYSDDTLQAYIEARPTLDVNGQESGYWLLTVPPTWTLYPTWIPTYDLAAAAATLWGEKAAVLAGDFDFSADGGNYTRSQAYEQAMSQARYWGSRQAPGTITLATWPRPAAAETVINLAETD